MRNDDIGGRRRAGASTRATSSTTAPATPWCTAPTADELIRRAGWTDLVFCGIATESCVLKSAADAFEYGYAPWIVTDASASDAGPGAHDAGLVVARRPIGTGQLVTAEHVVGQLTAYAGRSVLE
ncbi:isochorismatase family protein [Streptomyces sp. JV185]|uniref:isochorismatase family protein n=1 Tax=Streptomyces sp. JV185 TaxID=858638 RepID=UPI002E780B69|nr:isochorismatase family protein [Streptomyces sp. JV185]MEE1769434.1 isochorismatase family protein [Streptomyces sp. JV185]